MGKSDRLERRLFIWGLLLGAALTVLTLLADIGGVLHPLENWLYDRRAAWCQYFSKPPTDQIVHVDIDDRALETIGQWPWPRSRMARILEELDRADPKVVGIDVLFSEPQENSFRRQPDGKLVELDEDVALANALLKMGNVVLPASLLLTPPRSVSSFDSAVLVELTADLELEPPEIAAKLISRGFSPSQVPQELTDSMFLSTRRQAVYERIRAELDQSPNLSFDELFKRLLPRSDINISSPLKRVMEEQLGRFITVRMLRRFAVPVPASIDPLLPTQIKAMPVAKLGEVIAGSGYADVELNQPVIRWMPLLVQHDNRIFPQFGFAFACLLADVELKNIRISAKQLELPGRDGVRIIPVHNQYSPTYGRPIPLFVSVPWFGASRWEYMYDAPNFTRIRQHVPIGLIWDICETRDKIIRNNRSIDLAVETVLGTETENRWRAAVDPGKARAYQQLNLSPEEVERRRDFARLTLKELDDFPTWQILSQQKLEQLSVEEKVIKQELDAAHHALKELAGQNDALLAQLEYSRSQMKTLLQGKGVLIGWTATGAADMVTTSLHARCPGVVVHGVIANAVLTGQWWKNAPAWIGMLTTLLIGLGTAASTGWLNPWKGLLVAIGLILSFCLINGLLLFDYADTILEAGGPLVAIGSVWAGVTLMRLIVEGIERIQVARNLAVFRHEMELAKTVQVALIPKEAPKIDGIDPHGWTRPADLTGGDCFDLWPLPDGRMGLLVADASGHGLAPSMIVSQVRTLVRILSDTEAHPDPVLKRVNARLTDDLESSRFVTCFLGFVSGAGELQWCSCGHGPMYYCESENDDWKELESTALPLGIMTDWLPESPAPPIQLGPGGMLLVMSDGIFEAPNLTKEQFGTDRVLEILKKMRSAAAVEIVGAIREAVTNWQADKDSPADDQTIVVIRKVPAGVSVTAVKDQGGMVGETTSL